MDHIQKKAAQAIVNIFETGSALGNYASVTLLQGDSGHLTYGRAQTTLASGNLFFLIRDYCGASGASHAEDLSPYLERLRRRDFSLDSDSAFKSLLKLAGSDPVMQYVQDEFFDRAYWDPAIRICTAMELNEVLSAAVVYDSTVHGSWRRIAEETTAAKGPPALVGEREWIEGYCGTRRVWLIRHTNTLLRRTAYRMDALLTLIDQGNWSLALPFRVRGIELNEEILGEYPPVRVSAEDRHGRILVLTSPPLSGDDVTVVQNALKQAGFDIAADGIYGPGTENAVREFQRRNGLRVDGIVGPATRRNLYERSNDNDR